MAKMLHIAVVILCAAITRAVSHNSSTCKALKAHYKKNSCCGNNEKALCCALKAHYKTSQCAGKPSMLVDISSLGVHGTDVARGFIVTGRFLITLIGNATSSDATNDDLFHDALKDAIASLAGSPVAHFHIVVKLTQAHGSQVSAYFDISAQSSQHGNAVATQLQNVDAVAISNILAEKLREKGAIRYIVRVIDNSTSVSLHVGSAAPLAWCTSGGGWRAMVVGAGFANAFQQAPVSLFTSGTLTDVASNSGGTWFLSQFAYNNQFYKAIIESTPSELRTYIHNFMKAYDNVVSPSSSSVQNAEIRALMDVMGSSFFNEMLGVGIASSNHHYVWRLMVEDMLNAMPGINPGFYTNTVMNRANRQGLTGPTLHFQSALLTSAYLKGPSSFPNHLTGIYETYLYDESGNRLVDQGVALPSIPVQYVVPGIADSDNKTGWQLPSPRHYNYEAATLLRGNVHEAAPSLPDGPSVAYVAAASSAAAGALGSPSMLQEFFQASSYSSLWSAAEHILPASLQGLSICSNPLTEDNYCSYPSVKLVDGGYVDNLATAQTVAIMQKQHGVSEPIRLLLTDTPSGANTITVKALFNWTATMPGDILTDVEYSSKGIYLPSPQVFKTHWLDIDWIPLSPGPFASFKYAMVTTETVDNKAYGVNSGTPVKLLIFMASSNLSDFSYGKESEYADLAATIASSKTNTILHDWLMQS